MASKYTTDQSLLEIGSHSANFLPEITTDGDSVLCDLFFGYLIGAGLAILREHIWYGMCNVFNDNKFITTKYSPRVNFKLRI